MLDGENFEVQACENSKYHTSQKNKNNEGAVTEI